MRPVYAISGGVSKFAKARPDRTFQAIVKEAYDYAIADLGLEMPAFTGLVDGSVASYFSDHFTRQLMAGIMVQDYLGLCPKPSHRVEGGGATGGLCFQEAWKSVASGHMDLCVAYGFETMSHVETWKGNEFIALASDVSWDYPVGGFYSGYYAMMVTRHMKEFGTTVEQMAHVSVKNHINAYANPYAQKRNRYTIDDVRRSPMVAWPLTRLDICVMSDGAAVTVLASEDGLRKLEQAGGACAGRWCASAASAAAPTPCACPIARTSTTTRSCATTPPSRNALRTTPAPTIGSCGTAGRAIRACIPSAPAGPPATWPIVTPGSTIRLHELSFIELHDAYTSSELQTYEDLGLCRYGEGGPFAASGKAFLPGIDYGLKLAEKPVCPVNPSGGLIACGHPVGATGLMQAVFALWQLQGSIPHHFGDPALQVRDARRGAIHSHAGTGTYVTVSILEREN